MNVRCLAAACGVLAAAATVLDGQSRPGDPLPRDPQVLRSGVDVVTVAATVLDGNGQLVVGLPREAFEIYEDGDRQTITQFMNERVPIGLGMLLDVSDSMLGQRIIDARRAIERFLFDLLSPEDEYFLLTFNHVPHLLTRWTRDAQIVRHALDEVKPTGSTAMYDALLHALPLIRERRRQRAALVVVSDGADTASDAAIGEVRTALVRSDAFVYAVAIETPRPHAINRRVDATALNEITGQSGGHATVVRDAQELATATARIAEELNSQYVLGYPSRRANDGKYHSIRVSVKRPGHRVRARNGYVGSAAGVRSR